MPEETVANTEDTVDSSLEAETDDTAADESLGDATTRY